MRKNFFYRLNNFLILAVILFGGFLIFSKLNSVQSQTATGENPIEGLTSAPAYVINSEIDVELDPGSFTAEFKSDGITGKAGDDQKAKFANGGPQLIDTPLSFQFDKENSNLVTPGEVVYPAIPKGTAPTNYRCTPLANQGATKDNNCLYGVTMTSVFTDLETSVMTIGDRQYKVNTTNPNVYESIVGTLKEALNNLGKVVATNVGVPDQARSTVGLIQYWGDDDFQQYVKINGKNVFLVKVKTYSTGVNQAEGLFASEFSTKITANSAQKYKSINVIQAQLEQVGGYGAVYDPFTSTDPRPTTAQNFIEFSTALVQLITQENQQFAQKQQKLGAQVSLRTIQDADKYGLKYKLCDALASQNALPQNAYPNPAKEEVRTVGINPVTLQPITSRSCSYEDADGNKKDISCDNYEWYESLSRQSKQCITAIEERSDAKRAKDCALTILTGKVKDCNDFSVEEENLHLEMKDRAFPVGFGAYFQNGTLNNLDPRDTTGPYLNYLSPYFCSKLNLAFDLTAGKSYIYNVGAQNKNVSGEVKNGANNTTKVNILNQYCVLGGVMSNFAWALTQQTNNFGTNTPAGVINIPKEALTCDKKETAIFGATAVKSNIDGPDGLPYYIMDDNVRGNGEGGGKSGIQDEVALYHGYNSYPLTPIYRDEAIKSAYLEKYGDMDMQVVTDPASKKPKYIVFSAKLGDEHLALTLCKLPSNTSSYTVTEKSLCRIIDEGKFVFPAGVGMSSQKVKNPITGQETFLDSIVVVYQQPSETGASLKMPTSKFGKEGSGPLPFVYRYVDVFDQNNISTAQLSDQFVLPYTANADVIQGSGGNIFVGGISLANKSISDVGVTSISLGFRDISSEVQFTGTTNNTVVKRQDNSRKLTDNLCSSQGNYCKVLNSGAYVDNVKITQNPSTGGLYLLMIAGGFGVVYPVDPSGVVKNITASVFAYKTGLNNYKDEYDAILTLRVNSAGEFDMFLERSGEYLNVIPNDKLPAPIRSELEKKCGTNCLLTVQKHFDPGTFETDCSDYGGSGACGYPKLNKLGTPIVRSFVYGPSGKILAWYTQSGLDKTLLQSPDFLYSFTGAYTKMPVTNGGSGPSAEYSNGYYPAQVNKSTIVDDKSVSYTSMGAIPIRYRNYNNSGLLVGRDLRDKAGTITEVANANPEKLNCMRIYANNVSGIDLYFGDTGLKQTNLNPAGSASSPLKPVASSSNTTTGTSQNSGQYCEEKWCIPDEVGFVGDAKFGNDKNNGPLKDRIAAVVNQPRSYVDKVCEIASEQNVSCVVVAAIWKSESGGKVADNPRDPAFGCFLNKSQLCTTSPGKDTAYCKEWSSFENQVKCAVNSLVKQYNSYRPGAVLQGPQGVKFGPYETSIENGGGSCIPATKFSYTFQRYTPIDRRINHDNQCNKGLVIRQGPGETKPQDMYCSGIVPNNAARSDGSDGNEVGTVVYPSVWPEASQTRIALQRNILAMDIDGVLQAENTTCFPKSATASDNNTSGNASIASVLSQYHTSDTVQKGKFKLNVAGWGTDAGAGNIYMAVSNDWNQNGQQDDLQGAFVIPPGQSWSFNDHLGNFSKYSSGGSVDLSEVQSKYAKAPWNTSNFDFAKQGDNSNGWSELATAIRMAADSAVGSNNTRLTATQFNSRSELNPQPDKDYGTGRGWQRDIAHWSRAGVTVENYNSNLLDPSDRIPLSDVSKYVEIWNRPSNTSGFNDADLTLKNPYPADVDMILTIQLNEKGLITVEVIFGRKITSGSNTSNSCQSRSLVVLDVQSEVPLSRDGDGKIVSGPALVDVAAEAYAKARADIILQTNGVDVLDSVSDVLRRYDLDTESFNKNSINKSWHKTGRAVDLRVSKYDGRICGQGGANATNGCRAKEDGRWTIYQNDVNISAILEKYGFQRIPDQCATKGGAKCTEWWHYEYNDSGTMEWKVAMLQIWPKEKLKAAFPAEDWDSVNCVYDSGANAKQ